MIRNLKVLGLALVALFAMTATMAATASASPTFTTTKGATITGHEAEGDVKFKVTGSEVFCQNSSYHGVASAAATTSVTVTPTYTGCKFILFGEQNATVSGFGAGGCHYTLYSTGTADLACAAGKEVTVTAGPCTVHIPAQKGLGTIKYTTGTSAATGKKDLTLDLNITSITGNHTDGFLCPFGSSGHSTSGSIEGAVTATASVEGEPVDLTDH